MPIWLTIIFDVLKALFTGEFKTLWTEHKAKEAQDAQNKVISMSDAAVTNELRDKFTRPE